jgi:hypothetical protein
LVQVFEKIRFKEPVAGSGYFKNFEELLSLMKEGIGIDSAVF